MSTRWAEVKDTPPAFPDLLAQERAEAEWFGYAVKYKPGSRLGTGGRKAYTEPEWSVSRSVSESLDHVRHTMSAASKEDATRKLRQVLMKHSNDACEGKSVRGCTCQKIPFTILKDFPILSRIADFGFMPGSHCYSICHPSESQDLLHQVTKAGENNILIAQCIAIDLQELTRSLQYFCGLILSENCFGPAGAKLLFPLLGGNAELESLSISENSIGDLGCEDIPITLPLIQNLKSLCLAANEIGDPGVRCISTSITPCNCHDVMSKTIREDQLDVFRLLLKHGYPEKFDHGKAGLLFKAVYAGALSITEYLLEKGIDVDLKDSKGVSMASMAAGMGHLHVLKLLISRGADVSAYDLEGRTPLTQAAENGHSDVVPELIKALSFFSRKLHIHVYSFEYLPRNPPVHNDSNKSFATKWFSFEGTPSTGNQPRGRRASGAMDSLMNFTGLMTGKSRASMNTIPNEESDSSFSLPKGHQSSDDLGKCCLSIDFDGQNSEVTIPSFASTPSYLLDQRIAFTAMKSESSFFEITMLQKDENNERILGRAAIDLSHFAIRYGETKEVWCDVHGKSSTKMGSIKMYLNAVVDQLDHKTKLGRNAMLLAARYGNHEVLTKLGSNSANVESTDADGNTALILASRYGHLDAVRALLCLKADPEAVNRAQITAVMAAQQQGHTAVVQALLVHDTSKRGIPLSVKRLQPLPTQRNANDLSDDEFKGNFEKVSLKVMVHEARNLPIADVTGLSDPYCLLTLNHQEKKTRTIQRSLNPKWNQEIVFDDQLLTYWEKQTLLIEVFDSNLTTASVLLGMKKLDIARLFTVQNDVHNDWIFGCYHLVDERGTLVKGQQDKDLRTEGILENSDIALKFKFQKGSGRFLNVGIIEAKNLPKPKTRFTEPYCVIKYGEETVQTHSVNRQTGSRWDFHVRFDARSLDKVLEIELYDKAPSRFSSSSPEDILVACLDIPLDVLTFLISMNLNDVDLELFDGQGATLKGQGGHVSSLHVTFEVTDFDMSWDASKAEGSALHSTKQRQQAKLGLDAAQHLKEALSSYNRNAELDKHSALEEKCIEHQPDEIPMVSSREVLINIHEAAAIGQHVVLSESFKVSNPEITNQVGSHHGVILRVGSGTDDKITFIPSNLNVCMVWWDNIGQKIEHNIGKGDQYELALYQEPSEITAIELKSLIAQHRTVSLVHLNLDSNLIGNEGASYLASAIKSNEILQSLSLNGNNIRFEGAEALGQSLRSNGCLTFLGLCNNRIRDEGIREICKALEVNKRTKLRSMNVGNNCIGAAGMRFLAKMMLKADVVRILGLSNNLIGGDGAVLLAQGLRKSKMIHEMDLSNNMLGDIGASSIMKALRRMPEAFGKRTVATNMSLNVLILSRNNLSDRCAAALLDSVQHNKTLHTIVLDGNPLPEELMAEMKRCIQRNLEAAKLEQCIVKIQRAFRGIRHRRHKLAKEKLRQQIDSPTSTRASLPFSSTFALPSMKTSMPFSSTFALKDSSSELDINADEEEKTPDTDSETKEDATEEIADTPHQDFDNDDQSDYSFLKTRGKKEDENLLLTATRVTMFNMADAVMLENTAAIAMAQEAASKLAEAGDRYKRLEDKFYELMTDDDARQEEIVHAVAELNEAREEIFRAFEESEAAEEAARKCFEAVEAFARYEKEEEKIIDTMIHLQEGDVVEQQEPAARGELSDLESLPVGQEQDDDPAHRDVGGVEEISDERLIAEAVEEFCGDKRQEGMSIDEIESMLDLLLEDDGRSAVEVESMYASIEEEIAACAALTAAEMEACRKEMVEIKSSISLPS